MVIKSRRKKSSTIHLAPNKMKGRETLIEIEILDLAQTTIESHITSSTMTKMANHSLNLKGDSTSLIMNLGIMPEEVIEVVTEVSEETEVETEASEEELTVVETEASEEELTVAVTEVSEETLKEAATEAVKLDS